jgi:nucleoside-diphosphate-sugar epimerase/GT2 family glycosyltransferase
MSEQGACRIEPLRDPGPASAGQAVIRPAVSVVIVNFNGGPLLSACVRAVLTSTVAVEVIVSDNGSSDDSLAALRSACGADARLHIVAQGRNHGFARGNNLVLDRAGGDYLLFLNTDCIVQPDTLERLLVVMERYPQAGMCGCLIRNPDGSEQAGCRRSIPTPWRSAAHVLHLHRLFPNNPRFESFVLSNRPLPTQPVAVDAVSGAFMLVRRRALAEVGPLDEGYFMHCEDLDWCVRFREHGWQVLFVPDTAVTHYKGVCSEGRPLRVLWHKHRGMVHFYRKFFLHRYPRPLAWLVTLAVWTRFALLAVPLLIQRVWRTGAVAAAPPAPMDSGESLRTAVAHISPAAASMPLAGPVLVTGGTGFIGRHLVNALLTRGLAVQVMARHPAGVRVLWGEEQVKALAADLTQPPSLEPVCRGVETVFHLASHAHIEFERNSSEEALFHQVVVEGTRALLDSAVRAGVRRFIFFSTVKAMGEGGPTCLDEHCTQEPTSSYGRAKLEAERLVLAAGREHGLHVCILRFPLVYGPGNQKGNLPRMIGAIEHHLFPPLPEIGNRRSMVHVEDVVQAALLAAESPQANGQTYIVTDGEAYSVRDLYLAICSALARPAPTWSVPLGVLRIAARLGDAVERLGRRRFVINSEVLRKLVGSAWYSSDKISRELGYRPTQHLRSALPEIVARNRH